ncbi:MAG: preprotein translocase subunit YajC [Mogibacterium sp.]|nr:preprotein translocase subunit YajC [Mogibacterium sp.]
MATYSSLIILVVFIAIMYFLMIRPQKKKEKEEKAMREALAVGDEIMTIGGIVGKVAKITDKTVVISTANDRTKIEFIKTAVSQVIKKSGAAPAKPKSVLEEDEEPASKAKRDKKVTPKKLTKKSEDSETDAVAESVVEAPAEVEADKPAEE